MAKIKCTVNHPNLMLSVDGALQRMPEGGTIDVEEKHVKRYLENGNLKRYDDAEVLSIDSSEEERLQALRERAKELNIANSHQMKAETLETKIAEAEAAIEAANKAAGN